ncbi:MAG TPA: hypothetical protein VN838_18660 [Bradyrhizobium sp.]|nr:hypothetical protein [Bradyrhizobium sp.]
MRLTTTHKSLYRPRHRFDSEPGLNVETIASRQRLQARFQMLPGLLGVPASLKGKDLTLMMMSQSDMNHSRGRWMSSLSSNAARIS